jgi:hypothetical protein
MLKLGYTVDIGPLWAPVDLTTAGATGLRVALKKGRSCIFVVQAAAAASGTEDLVFTLKEHTAATSGTTQNFANITTAWVKSATTLAGTETWSKITQAASATLTLAGTTYAAKQLILAVQVNAPDLDAGYDYVSLSVADPGAVSRLGGGVTLLTDLVERRDPANLVATLF